MIAKFENIDQYFYIESILKKLVFFYICENSRDKTIPIFLSESILILFYWLQLRGTLR